MRVLGDVLVDGRPTDPASATISVFDLALLRGFGCFEALRSYAGVAFRQREHLDRLERSAAALGITLPDRNDMERWVSDRASVGDSTVRVVMTGGLDAAGTDASFIVFAEPLPEVPATITLLPVDAPWHPDGEVSELTGAKTISYGPNIAARRRAIEEGYGDALLIGRSGTVLEGPTNTIAWVTDGVFETPELGLGILASVTRRAVLEVADELGIPVREGRYPLGRLLAADEVMTLSTVREVQPVIKIAETDKPVGDITNALADGFKALVTRETRGVQLPHH